MNSWKILLLHFFWVKENLYWDWRMLSFIDPFENFGVIRETIVNVFLETFGRHLFLFWFQKCSYLFLVPIRIFQTNAWVTDGVVFLKVPNTSPIMVLNVSLDLCCVLFISDLNWQVRMCCEILLCLNVLLTLEDFLHRILQWRCFWNWRKLSQM